MKDQQEESEMAIQVAPEIDRAEMALIDRAVATSRAYPRNITRATNNAIAIVTMDKETAEICRYMIPRAGKRISGPTVHMAKILAQNYGNLRVEAKITGIDATAVISTAVAWDLESNVAIKMEVRRSILDKGGKRYSEDMIGVTSNAANAISLRNAILAVIPKSVVDKVYKAANAMIIGDVSDATKLISRRKQVIDQLKGAYNVTEEEILKAIGKASVDHIDADDIVDLIGIGTAIKDGDSSVEQIFKGKQTSGEPEIDADELALLFLDKKDKMTETKRKDAERIISGKEVNSYKKLKKELEAIK